MSDEEKKQALINVEDTLGLSKPATALIEKISAGLGGVFAVYLAKQRVEVQKMETALVVNATLEDDDIRKRSELRLICQEIRKQKNIESIAEQAVKELPPDASTENIQKMDEDWIAYLFKHCDIVSDKDMQLIWGRILAREATKTGTFSKRTLDIVSKLDKEDAKLFTNFCQFVWLSKGTDIIALIYDHKNSIYNQERIIFPTLQHLESIGLMSIDVGLMGNSFGLCYETSQPVIWHYHDTTVLLYPKKMEQDNKHSLPTGRVILTQSGRELFPISGASRNDAFFNYVINILKEKGHNPVIQNPETVNTTE